MKEIQQALEIAKADPDVPEAVLDWMEAVTTHLEEMTHEMDVIATASEQSALDTARVRKALSDWEKDHK